MPQPSYWQRMRRRRLSRRALLRASARAGVGAAGLALVGCGSDDDDAQQPVVTAAPPQQQQPAQTMEQAEQQAAQTEQQGVLVDDHDRDHVQEVTTVPPSHQYGGNYSVNVTSGWDHIDPHRANFRLPFVVFSDSLGRLFQIDDNRRGVKRHGVWHPDVSDDCRGYPFGGVFLAPDIASVPEFPDPETYVFSFNEGARFWDRYPTEGGRLFTAEDAAVNITRQIEAVDASGQPDDLFLRSGLYQQTTSVEIFDELTLVLQTEGPNAAYLESVYVGYSFLTSPEAIDLWDLKWRDERSNMGLISGTGPFIPTELDENLCVHLVRNGDYWKSLEGQQMPFFDSITWNIFSDPAAIETAYRNGELDHATWGVLNTAQIDGLHEDFPDHIRYDRGNLLPIGMRFNYNTEWAENPWLDRRVPYAFHLAMDRDAIINFIYLGKGTPSTIQRLNWYHCWAIPDNEMRQLPGYRPSKEQDIADARALLDAAGVDPEAEFPLVNAREFEAAHPGSSELYADMFSDALGIPIKIVLEPHVSIFQQLAEGTFPGHVPIWLPSGTDDPTSAWSNELVFGAGGNNERYDFAPVEEIIKQMRVTIEEEKRYELAREVSLILLGEDERYGLDGFAPTSIVGNGIESSLYRPYLNLPDRAKSTWGDEGYHWNKEAWFTRHHPDIPARARRR